MSSTRVVTLITFVLGTAGLVMLSAGESIFMVVGGAMLVVGSAILFSRHFWRESDRKRKQESAAYSRSLQTEFGKSQRSANVLVEEHLRGDLRSITDRIDGFSRGILEYVSQVQLDLDNVKSRQQRTDDRVAKRFEQAERLASKRRDSVVKQVSAILGLYYRFRPSAPFPPFGGWAIGGECAHVLVELILESKPHVVFEAGSGLSTLLIAHALEEVGGEGRVISLEHDSSWYQKSVEMIAEHGLSHRSEIHLASLVETEIGEENFRWYDLTDVVLPEQIDFVFVDGPPEATGNLARYPVLPLIYSRLAPGATMLMDDARRQGEMEAIERWRHEFEGLDVQILDDSKGTAVIKRR